MPAVDLAAMESLAQWRRRNNMDVDAVACADGATSSLELLSFEVCEQNLRPLDGSRP